MEPSQPKGADEWNRRVLKQLARIQQLPLEDLRDQWRVLNGTEPPASYGKMQLVRRLSWRIQELRYGGLSEMARFRLREIADADDQASSRQRPRKRKRHTLAPGTRLIRHWRGTEHIVTTLVDGRYEWNGKTYRTLSAIAKAITGQHGSGPRFFGLVGRNKENL